MSAERYLRRLVERAVDPQDPERPGLAELRVAAEALVAAGQATAALSGELLADAHLALVIRGEAPATRGNEPWGETRWPPAGVGAPAPRAVAPGPVRFETADGDVTVTLVTFGPDGADIRLWGSPAQPEERPAPPPGPSVAARRSPAGAPGSRGTSGPRRTTPRSPAPAPGPSPAARRHRLFASLPARWDGGSKARVVKALGDLRVSDPEDGVARSVPVGAAPFFGERWMLTAPLDPPPALGVPWVDVSLGDGQARLPVTGPGPTVDGRRHRRSPGSVWVLGRLLARAAERPDESFGLIVPAVHALVAVGQLDPADPLVHQAGLLDGRIPTGPGDPALDPRWKSPMMRAAEPVVTEGVWPLATAVNLGAHVVRLDALVADRNGTVLHGACATTGSWPSATPLVLSAFDDRHNWYTLTPTWSSSGSASKGTGVDWQLQPGIDPAATGLRLDLTSVEEEAAVEVRLR